MAKRGRPKIEFDIKHVQLLGRFRATYETMADWFECSVDTIRRQMQDTDSEFCKAYKKASTHLKMALSEAQIKLALSGNCGMLVWLGKQNLGQSDKIENTGAGGGPIQLSGLLTHIDLTDIPVAELMMARNLGLVIEEKTKKRAERKLINEK